MTDHTRPVTGYPAPPASNGYAYPYAAHPQPTYFNVAGNPNPYQNPHHQRAAFLRRVITVFIACIILIGTILFIIWLVLRPQLPHFRLQTLTLTNFTLTPTPTPLISGTWTAALSARNPNSKITLHYDHPQAALFYHSQSIAVTTLPPFVQGKNNDTTVTATFASASEYFDDINGISDERARGAVEFNFRMVARVRFKAVGWWTRRRVLRVYCPHLSVGVSANSSSGSLTGGSKDCRVGA